MLYAASRAGSSYALVVLPGIMGFGAVAAGIAARSTAPFPAGLLLVGAEYAAALLVRGGTVDGLAPAVAGALFAVAELSYLAVERELGTYERAVVLRRVVTIVLSALVTGTVGAVVVTASDVGLGGGVLLEAIGVVSAVAAVGVAAALAWRRREDAG